PWAAWSVVYALAHMIKGRAPILLKGLVPFGILAGTNAHLWYLPFAFIVSCVILLVEGLLPHRTEGADNRKPAWNHTAAALCAISTLAGIVVLARWRAVGGGQGLPEPLGQWAHAAPAVLAGLVFRYAASGLARWTFAVALAIASSYAWVIGDPGTGIAYLAGTTGFMVLSTVPVFVDARIRVWSACAYGVYLVHPLVYQGFTRLVWVPMDFIGATVTFCICLAVVYWARKIDFAPLRRIL
ncbi:MAG: acyltransferase family protein, partial [Acidobacteriota bacterium]